MRNSMVPSIAVDPVVTNSSDASTTNSFAFLVHSQDTLPHNLPPNVDNKLLARQKRRRTSPEDQVVLEAEYQRNPKPDKAARINIVNRVALGEKEVQIWFQNRRQNTRRKSRPLLPHEIIPSLRSSFGQTVVDDAIFFSQSSDDNVQNTPLRNNNSPEDINGVDRDPVMKREDYNRGASHASGEKSTQTHVLMIGNLEKTTQDSLDPTRSPFVTNSSDARESLSQDSVKSVQPPDTVSIDSSGKSSQDTTHHKASFDATSINTSDLEKWSNSQVIARDSTRALGYLSNRRNATVQTSYSPRGVLQPILCPGQGASIDPRMDSGINATNRLIRTSSLVRLSMSLDGKANVVTDNEISPPRPQVPISTNVTKHIGLLQRSHSAISLGDSLKQSQTENQTFWPRRAPSGRSRDARTWEFYCDSDARNALSEKAKQEQSGSAIGAIGLLRSRSNNSLTPNLNKRNVTAVRPGSSKRVKSNSNLEQKPKLARSSSSVARLQTVNGTKKPGARSKVKSNKPGSQYAENRISSGDSDKENWLPGTQQMNPRQRHLPNSQLYHQHSRRILEENSDISSASRSAETSMNNEHNLHHPTGKGFTGISEVDLDLENDNEVADFMAESDVPREEEDLDCVQNLLSLSQGNWR
ncbi:MAG: hypothetical protein M1827_004095 [Pycnora praestabilis]|nr:MAG: hypothetical protein M1827_004095 [Pycnora praestabilis]